MGYQVNMISKHVSQFIHNVIDLPPETFDRSIASGIPVIADAALPF